MVVSKMQSVKGVTRTLTCPSTSVFERLRSCWEHRAGGRAVRCAHVRRRTIEHWSILGLVTHPKWPALAWLDDGRQRAGGAALDAMLFATSALAAFAIA